jgi:hypothetical protein
MTSRDVLRVLARGVLPAVTLLALALAHCVVRSVGLALFVAAAGYRVADLVLDRAADEVPRPHWNPRTPRPVPAPPEVTP